MKRKLLIFIVLLLSTSWSCGACIFLADYNDSNLDADYSAGSPTATFAASRDATHPATYFDASGVMQKTTTANVGRFNYGYYDTTGWNKWSDGDCGVLLEGASTNYSRDSMFGRAIGDDIWDSHWGIITDNDSSIINISGAKERRIIYVFLGTESDWSTTLRQFTGNSTFDASGANIEVTLSFWIRGDISGITSGTSQHRFFLLEY